MKFIKITLIALFFFGLNSSTVFASDSCSAYKKDGTSIESNNKIVKYKKATRFNKIKQKLFQKRLSKISKKIKNKKNLKDDMTLLLVIIALFIPPIAVFLLEDGLTTNFWIDLLLTIFFFIPGVIFALYLILK